VSANGGQIPDLEAVERLTGAFIKNLEEETPLKAETAVRALGRTLCCVFETVPAWNRLSVVQTFCKQLRDEVKGAL